MGPVGVGGWERIKESCPPLRPPSSAYLKEDDKGQADGQEEPELLRKVVVRVIAVVSVPGEGKNQSQGSGAQRTCTGGGVPNLHNVTFPEPCIFLGSSKCFV